MHFVLNRFSCVLFAKCQIMKLLIMQVYSAFCYFNSRRLKYSSQHAVPKRPQSMLFLQVETLNFYFHFRGLNYNLKTNSLP